MHTIASTPWALQTGVYEALRGWYLARSEAALGIAAGQSAKAHQVPDLRAIVGTRPDMAQGGGLQAPTEDVVRAGRALMGLP